MTREFERAAGERLRTRETHIAVLTFGRVEDLLSELPSGGTVRLDTMIRDGRRGKYGLGMRTASIIVSARRGDEILAAKVITGFIPTANGAIMSEREARLAEDNTDAAEQILREQLGEAGYEVLKGTYALPQDAVLYRATSDRIGWEEGRVVRKGGSTN